MKVLRASNGTAFFLTFVPSPTAAGLRLQRVQHAVGEHRRQRVVARRQQSRRRVHRRHVFEEVLYHLRAVQSQITNYGIIYSDLESKRFCKHWGCYTK